MATEMLTTLAGKYQFNIVINLDPNYVHGDFVH